MKIKCKWKLKMSGSIPMPILPEICAVVDVLGVPCKSPSLARTPIPHLPWVFAAEVCQLSPSPWVKEHMWGFCQLLSVFIPTKNSRTEFKTKKTTWGGFMDPLDPLWDGPEANLHRAFNSIKALLTLLGQSWCSVSPGIRVSSESVLSNPWIVCVVPLPKFRVTLKSGHKFFEEGGRFMVYFWQCSRVLPRGVLPSHTL